MEKKEPDEERSEETVRLEKENAHLRRELAIETRVTKRWQALAGIFHDTLINALRRYDPACFEKLQEDVKKSAPGKEAAGCLQTRAQTGEQTSLSENAAIPAQLEKENASLSEALAAQMACHKKWEQTAVRFHDTLWQVLLKYEPDTYGAICPARAKEAAPDFTGLPEMEVHTEQKCE